MCHKSTECLPTYPVDRSLHIMTSSPKDTAHVITSVNTSPSSLWIATNLTFNYTALPAPLCAHPVPPSKQTSSLSTRHVIVGLMKSMALSRAQTPRKGRHQPLQMPSSRHICFHLPEMGRHTKQLYQCRHQTQKFCPTIHRQTTCHVYR